MRGVLSGICHIVHLNPAIGVLGGALVFLSIVLIGGKHMNKVVLVFLQLLPQKLCKAFSVLSTSSFFGIHHFHTACVGVCLCVFRWRR